MPETIHKYTENLPKNIQQFRSTDFNHPNFKTSGLFKELIEGHYFLLENMGQSLDSVYTQMNTSTDYLIKSLQKNDSLLNTVSETLFKYFEKRSLYPAAANLSTQMLSQNQCVLSTSLANTMQKYKDLKVGAVAPEIQLDATTTLSSLKKPALLVFGASWCKHCKKEALELRSYYDTWKAKKNIEVVYISLDTDKKAFKTA
jgi:thiol-disulfide isomerase/thioredoxin